MACLPLFVRFCFPFFIFAFILSAMVLGRARLFRISGKYVSICEIESFLGVEIIGESVVIVSIVGLVGVKVSIGDLVGVKVSIGDLVGVKVSVVDLTNVRFIERFCESFPIGDPVVAVVEGLRLSFASL